MRWAVLCSTGTEATLLGFVGTPWTLAAYSMEGKAEKDCKETKVRRRVTTHRTQMQSAHTQAASTVPRMVTRAGTERQTQGAPTVCV